MTDMTDLEFRPLREEEFAEAVELDSIAFAEQHLPEDVPAFKKAFDFGRSYCAFDEGRLVGITSALTLGVDASRRPSPAGVGSDVGGRAPHPSSARRS